MKGFTPMKGGMKAGFHFPKSHGFTGSTGKVTQVGGYARRKYATGGAVKHIGRMTRTEVGDVGNALTQRSKPSNNLDQQSGGKTGLRPGFKGGGGNWIAGATKNKGALHRALGVPAGEKIPAKKMAKAAASSSPLMRKRVGLANTLKAMNKADGGRVGVIKGVITAAEKKMRGDRAVKRAMKGAYSTPGVDPYNSRDVQAEKWEKNAQQRADAGKDYSRGGATR